jgi:hypothetical protein
MKENGRPIPKGLYTWFARPPKWDDIFNRKYRYSELGLSTIEQKDDFRLYLGDIYAPLLKDAYILPSTGIIRKSCITSDIKFVDDNWLCGDWDFFARLSRKHPCGYLDVETAINRSHGDNVRITRRSPAIGAKDRLALIRSVWKDDKDFYEKQRNEVDRVERYQIIRLVKYLLLDSDVRGARKHLRKLKNSKWENDTLKILLLFLCAYLPAGHKLLALLR